MQGASKAPAAVARQKKEKPSWGKRLQNFKENSPYLLMILPAVLGYTDRLAAGLNEKEKASAALGFRAERRRLEKLSLLSDDIDVAIEDLEESVDGRDGEDATAQAFYIRDVLLEKMAALRRLCDEAEGRHLELDECGRPREIASATRR